MNTLPEIKRAIEALLTHDRVQLIWWLHHQGYVLDQVTEAAVAYGRRVPGKDLTVEEYLELEKETSGKHEYVAGQLYAMSGVSKRQGHITLNLGSAFRDHVKRGPCKVFVSELKVLLTAGIYNYVYYPDVVVACDLKGKDKDDDEYVVRDPKLIVEVLSPSTARFDRGEKLMNYRCVPTLEEYVFIAQKEHLVAIHRRSEEWKPVVLTSVEDIAEFRSIKLSLPLATIYEDVFSRPEEA